MMIIAPRRSSTGGICSSAKQNGQIEGINKKGLIVGLPATVVGDIGNTVQ